LEEQSPGGGFVGLENRGDKQNRGEEKKDGASKENSESNFAEIIKDSAGGDENNKGNSGDGQKNNAGDDTHGEKEEPENDRIADILEKQVVSRFNGASQAKIGKDDIEFSEDFGEGKDEYDRNQNRDRENSYQNSAKPGLYGNEIDHGNGQDNDNQEDSQEKQDGELEKLAKIFFSGLPACPEVCFFVLADEIHGLYESGFGDEGDEEQNYSDYEKYHGYCENNLPMGFKKTFSGLTLGSELIVVSDIEASGRSERHQKTEPKQKAVLPDDFAGLLQDFNIGNLLLLWGVIVCWV
jgi:hypothetical protein